MLQLVVFLGFNSCIESIFKRRELTIHLTYAPFNSQTNKREINYMAHTEKIQYLEEQNIKFTKIHKALPQKLNRIYAVIIGVSDFKPNIKKLKYADDDATLFYNFLKSKQGGSLTNENITLLLNKDATRGNILRAINNQFKEASEEDIIILYMATHGSPSNRAVYFLGSDTEINNLEGTGLHQQEIFNILNRSNSKKKIWILDACHSGVVGIDENNIRTEKERSTSVLMDRYLTKMVLSAPSHIILTASSAGQTSEESAKWGGGHGVFTYYMVDGLKGQADDDKDGLVNIRELYEYVRIKVSTDTNRKQYPELKGIFSDRFLMSIVDPK